MHTSDLSRDLPQEIYPLSKGIKTYPFRHIPFCLLSPLSVDSFMQMKTSLGTTLATPTILKTERISGEGFSLEMEDNTPLQRNSGRSYCRGVPSPAAARASGNVRQFS